MVLKASRRLGSQYEWEREKPGVFDFVCNVCEFQTRTHTLYLSSLSLTNTLLATGLDNTPERVRAHRMDDLYSINGQSNHPGTLDELDVNK